MAKQSRTKCVIRKRIYKTKGLHQMNKNNLKTIERIQRQMVAHQASLQDLSSSIHHLYLGELQNATRAMEEELATNWIKNQKQRGCSEFRVTGIV